MFGCKILFSQWSCWVKTVGTSSQLLCKGFPYTTLAILMYLTLISLNIANADGENCQSIDTMTILLSPPNASSSLAMNKTTSLLATTSSRVSIGFVYVATVKHEINRPE